MLVMTVGVDYVNDNVNDNMVMVKCKSNYEKHITCDSEDKN